MTTLEVAQFMVKKVEAQQILYQDMIAYDIHIKFGKEFVCLTERGNLSIDKKVLQEFRKLTEGTVVWEKYAHAWRLRRPSDAPGKRQVSW